MYKVYVGSKLKSSERSDLGSGETATEQARKEESESAIRRGRLREEGGKGSTSDTLEGGKRGAAS